MIQTPPIEELTAAAKWRTNPKSPVNLRRSRDTEELADFACNVLLHWSASGDVQKAAERLRRIRSGERGKVVYGFTKTADERIDDGDCEHIEILRRNDESLLAAEYESLANEMAELRHAIAGFPNLPAMREQMEELAAENRLLKQQMQALQDSGNFRKLVRNKRLADQAAQTHGCHDCGEERPARVVAGKLTCPECGSENIICID